ncbi:alpha/beta-hydrolase [Calocera viscosa TUFC12733]|uniref:Alpha/beta-hydrolase n=1 Tax=Calocera viscosa (strain TUFC12733) TaxID=1330018 RepID=A0A167JZE0_CALVF|nr:alpha/beta-hydrolase [Calocera viscosa TUFC12733]
MFLLAAVLSSLILGTYGDEPVSAKPAFDPRAYTPQTAACPAVDRSVTPPLLKTIDLKYVDINPPKAKKALLLVHGWPSLWSTWANQIQEFENDYHLIVPDLRGFGSSGHPGDVQSSSQMEDIVSDLTCILDQAGVNTAVCVGHDWGAEACWEAGRQRPDRFTELAGAVVPYMPSAGPYMPIEAMTQYLPKLTYQIYFANDTTGATTELDSDIRRTLRGTLRSVQSPPPAAFLTSTTSFMEAWADVADIPAIPFMTEDEEDYMVESYTYQGFGKTLQFYTNGNRYGSYLFQSKQGNFSLAQPALWIVPTQDPVADWLEVDQLLHSDQWFSNLTVKKVSTAHWPQLEQPAEFNSALSEWLSSLEPANPTRARDEL